VRVGRAVAAIGGWYGRSADRRRVVAP
jgi:hypothetical protein